MKRILVTAILLLVLFITPAFGQDGCILYSDGTPPTEAAEVAIPEGFTCPGGETAAGETPEYYLLPTDADSDVRFLYYTTGRGDPKKLAEAALTSYSMLYDEFTAGEIRDGDFNGRACLHFDYTCAYPNRAGDALVYEQTAVAYIPLDGDEFIACIVSLAFDDAKSYLSAEAIQERLASAMNAITLPGQ